MSSTEEPFRTSVADRVATITLQRPKALNALSLSMLEGLLDLMAAYHRDPAVRCVIMTGEGRAFCAGGDLRDLSTSGDGTGDGFRYGAGVFHQLVLSMRSLPKPIIAAIQGVAAGGGMSLALACDLRIMAEDTFMQVGYLGRGFSTDGGLSYHLPRLVGPSVAFELAVSDTRIEAKRCLSLGLVNQLVAADEVVATATARAGILSRGPSLAMARAKELMFTTDRSLADHMERERVALGECVDSREGREGLRAFLAKRDPDFLCD